MATKNAARAIALSLISYILSSCFSFGWAGLYDEVNKKYPTDAYLVGIGEVNTSGDIIKDRKRAEILARLDIAKQIKIKVKETAFDVMCEGEGKAMFADLPECRNQFITIAEATVDEVLEGSRIEITGEDKGRSIFFAVAVLPKNTVISRVKGGYEESIDKATELIGKARSSQREDTRNGHLREAREEVKKAMAYETNRAALEGTKSKAGELFGELAKEIGNIE